MSFEIQYTEAADIALIQALLERYNLSPNLSRCRYVLKACLDGEIVGAVGLEFWGDYVSLRALIVDKPRRRCGVGKALVRAAIDLARTDGALGVYAYTLFWNNRFFRSLGFERVDKTSVPEDVKESARFHAPRYKYCCVMAIPDLVD